MHEISFKFTLSYNQKYLDYATRRNPPQPAATRRNPPQPAATRRNPLILAIWALPFFGQAQFAHSFIVEVPPNQVFLSIEEQNRFSFVQNAPETKSSKFISLGDVSNLQVDGAIHFILPNSPDTLKVTAAVVDYTDSLNYKWAGNIGNGRGNLVMLRNQSGYYGRINIDSKSYEIAPLSATRYLLVEKNVPTGPFTCPDGSEEGGGDDPTPCIPENEYNTCPSTVSVLFLLPPDAQDWLNNTYPTWVHPLYLQLSGLYTDFAFYNSDIPNKNVRIIIDPVPFNFTYDPNDNVDFEKDELADPDGDAQARRDLYQADAVFMLTSHFLCRPLMGCPILGSVADIGLKKDRAFSIVRISYLNEGYVFSHEFGHLASCRHQRSTDPNTGGTDDDPDCAHGHTYANIDDLSNQFGISTILGSPFSDFLGFTDYRILNYSNPDVSVDFMGPTGYNHSNNARRLRNSLCSFANFYPTTELQAAIVPPTAKCSRIYSASVTPPSGQNYGQPPYSYNWYWNTSGVFFNPNFSYTQLPSGTNPTVDLTGLPCQFFLCLTVVSADGVMIKLVKKISFLTCPGCTAEPDPFDPNDGLFAPKNPITATFIDRMRVRIYPNPVKQGSSINIQPTQSEDPEKTVRIFDCQGKLLVEYQMPTAPVLEIGISDLPSGVYFMQLIGTEHTEGVRFTIINQ